MAIQYWPNLIIMCTSTDWFKCRLHPFKHLLIVTFTFTFSPPLPLPTLTLCLPSGFKRLLDVFLFFVFFGCFTCNVQPLCVTLWFIGSSDSVVRDRWHCRVCLTVLNTCIRKRGCDMSRAGPASRPVTAGTGSSTPAPQIMDKWVIYPTLI